jgi:hypothetical protein
MIRECDKWPKVVDQLLDHFGGEKLQPVLMAAASTVSWVLQVMQSELQPVPTPYANALNIYGAQGIRGAADRFGEVLSKLLSLAAQYHPDAVPP